MLKSVKIREESYEWLVKLAGELQQQRGIPVSIDDALRWLQKKGNIADLAGSWKMSDAEYSEFMKKLRAGWRKWKPASA